MFDFQLFVLHVLQRPSKPAEFASSWGIGGRRTTPIAGRPELQASGRTRQHPFRRSFFLEPRCPSSSLPSRAPRPKRDKNRAGESELGVTMAVIPWVACHPSSPHPAGGDADDEESTASTGPPKPVFLFLEGIDANEKGPGGGGGSSRHDTPAPRAGRRGRAPSFTTLQKQQQQQQQYQQQQKLGHQRGRSGSSGSSSVFPFFPSPGSPRPSAAAVAANSSSMMAALSLRPLEVVVYASLSFRNLLPVGVGWRVAGAR